jgi:type I restriction-modification system DNA methylase subunit
VFRGELGQYFTMRQIARFTVAALDIDLDDYVIDPTAGSGGFLLEVLLQGWHRIERDFAGQTELERKKYDFAMHQVFGIEIHEILGRILKINLLLHHDGHTNVEGNRSCLDTDFINQRLRTSWRGGFHRVVGNPPFGDTVKAHDTDLLGENDLESFQLADGRTQVASEHVITERGIDMLAEGGKLGFVIPDGMLNNQGERSGCPAVRRLLASSGVIEAIISLPDYAFRKSGAQNKTSILIFRKFDAAERQRWNTAHKRALAEGQSEDDAIAAGLRSVGARTFLAEATNIGYTPTGSLSDKNDLYRADEQGLRRGRPGRHDPRRVPGVPQRPGRLPGPAAARLRGTGDRGAVAGPPEPPARPQVLPVQAGGA